MRSGLQSARKSQYAAITLSAEKGAGRPDGGSGKKRPSGGTSLENYLKLGGISAIFQDRTGVGRNWGSSFLRTARLNFREAMASDSGNPLGESVQIEVYTIIRRHDHFFYPHDSNEKKTTNVKAVTKDSSLALKEFSVGRSGGEGQGKPLQHSLSKRWKGESLAELLKKKNASRRDVQS